MRDMANNLLYRKKAVITQLRSQVRISLCAILAL